MSLGQPSAPPLPDLTHLTDEERNIIQSVIERQKACDAETNKLQRWVYFVGFVCLEANIHVGWFIFSNLTIRA